MIKGNFDISLDFLRVATPPLIGVDISPSSIKMLELARSGDGDGLIVERYVIEVLPENSITDGNINNLEAVSNSLQRAWQRLDSHIKNVSVALPAATVITKKIFLPAGLSDDELEYQVESEANQFIPFALDEVNLDFQVIQPSASSFDEIEVLLAASRKANVEDRVAAVQLAGLKAVVVDVEPYAAEAAFAQICAQLPEAAVDQCVALIDIGNNVMNVNVLRNGESIYMRDQPIGGAQLTEHIHRYFDISLAEAELAKRKGGLPEQYTTEILTPFLESIAGEVIRALQFFYSSTAFSEVSYVVLAGGCAALAGLDEMIADRTQISTMVANPFEYMTLARNVNASQLRIDAPALMIACGLALRRFDPS